MRVRHPLGSVPYHNADWLREQLVTYDRTYEEIAAEFGVAQNTIGYFAKKFGIPNPHGSGQRRGLKCGPNHHNWKGGRDPYASTGGAGWRAVRKEAKERTGYTCERCGKRPEKARALDVHHKDGNRQNNTPDNLIVLCRSCHNKEHGTLPPWQRRKG